MRSLLSLFAFKSFATDKRGTARSLDRTGVAKHSDSGRPLRRTANGKLHFRGRL